MRKCSYFFWWTVPFGADSIRYKNFFLMSSQHPPSFTQEHIRNRTPLLFISPSCRIRGAGCGNICSIWLQQIPQLFSWKEAATLKRGAVLQWSPWSFSCSQPALSGLHAPHHRLQIPLYPLAARWGGRNNRQSLMSTIQFVQPCKGACKPFHLSRV